MKSGNKIWGFIGCGNLSQAIISGALQKKTLLHRQIIATNRSQPKILKFSKKHKFINSKSNSDLISKSSVVILGVKPQDLEPVLMEMSKLQNYSSSATFPVVISLAAGVKMSRLREFFPNNPAVIRVMANLPAQVFQGVFGIYLDFHPKLSAAARLKVRKEVLAVFSSLGLVVEVHSDAEVNVITAAAASGVGFVFEFIRIFESWIQGQGLETGDAKSIAIQTFFGASLMALQNQDVSLEYQRDAVTSKKGTTFAGLKSLSENNLEKILKLALQASQSRAESL